MLVQVYRCGPSRHRIVKGYTLAEVSPELVAERLGARGPTSISVRANTRNPHAVWLDTGMVWLHTAVARNHCLAELNDAILLLAEVAKQAGGALLPSAVRPNQTQPWSRFLCGDQHFLETLDPTEAEVFCNLIRIHTPLLIACSGRPGVDSGGVESLGSRRLSDSREHFAPQYLASVAPTHLERVAQCLRRDVGVTRLSVLDVNPLGDPEDAVPNVELRFNDAQMLLSSVRAQAILYQALLLKARRLARDGRRVGYFDQRLLERNRARAVTKGLQSSFEQESSRSSKKGSRQRQGEKINKIQSGDSMLLDLLDNLQTELQVLEVEFAEIAPLILGSSLRQRGLAGLRTESDLFRATHEKWSGDESKFMQYVTSLFLTSNSHQIDPVRHWNEHQFPQAAQLVRRSWAQLLRYSQSQANSSSRKSTPNSPFNGSAQTLVDELQALGRKPTPTQAATCLDTYVQIGASTNLYRELQSLSRADQQGVRKWLTPPRKLQLRSKTHKAIWGDATAGAALDLAREHGVCLVSIFADQHQEKVLTESVDRFRSDAPEGFNAFLFTYRRFNHEVSGKPRIEIELLVSRMRRS